MKLVAKRQKAEGFALLEVVLGLIVLGLGVYGVTSLFSGAKSSNAVQTQESALQQLSSATANFINANPDQYSTFTNDQVLATGNISPNMIMPLSTGSTSQVMFGPFGQLISGPQSAGTCFGGAQHSCYAVVMGSVPAAQVNQLITDMIGTADASVAAGTPGSSATLGAAPKITTVTDISPTYIANAKTTYDVTFYFPKGGWSAS